MSYQTIEIDHFGGPEVLELKQREELPEPTSKQIRVKVVTAGTGFTDTIVRQGNYPGVRGKLPFTPGYDWVGIVDKVGSEVEGLQVGQLVADMPVTGGYTQYLCVDADRVVRCPEGVDPAQAVCMVLPYTTAYQMLTRECDLKPGDSILVHAAAGTVGTALLELAKEMQLKVYATASVGKHSLLRQLGAIPIDYRNEDFVERVLTLNQGGVNAVFDTVGATYWGRSYRCLKAGGKLVGFGSLKLAAGEESVVQLLWGLAKLQLVWPLLPNGRSSSFYNIESRRRKFPEQFQEDLTTLMQWLADGRLNPVIEQQIPLAQVQEVHRRIDRGEVQGRTVLICH